MPHKQAHPKPTEVKVLQNDPKVGPRSVQDAKLVNLALVSYTDENNRQMTCLAVVGEHNVHMLDGKSMGFSQIATPQGKANDWLRDGIFTSLATKGS
jgi:hypothetical protein